MKLWLLWFSVFVCCFLRFRFDSGLRPGGLTFLALQWPYRSVLHTSEKVCCHGFSGSGKRWWAECVSIIFYSIGFRYHFTRSGAVLLDRRTVAASSVKHRCVIFFIELRAPRKSCEHYPGWTLRMEAAHEEVPSTMESAIRSRTTQSTLIRPGLVFFKKQHWMQTLGDWISTSLPWLRSIVLKTHLISENLQTLWSK